MINKIMEGFGLFYRKDEAENGEVKYAVLY